MTMTMKTKKKHHVQQLPVTMLILHAKSMFDTCLDTTIFCDNLPILIHRRCACACEVKLVSNLAVIIQETEGQPINLLRDADYFYERAIFDGQELISTIQREGRS